MATIRNRVWSYLAFVVLFSVMGWLCIDGPISWALEGWLSGQDPRLSRVGWMLLAFVLGGAFALVLPRWWYLAPLAGVAMDLVLLFRGFAAGGDNLWPIVVKMRIIWTTIAMAGALTARVISGFVRWREARS